MKTSIINKVLILIKQNLGLALPLLTMIWFAIFFLITSNINISSLAGILIGFFGTIIIFLNIN